MILGGFTSETQWLVLAYTIETGASGELVVALVKKCLSGLVFLLTGSNIYAHGGDTALIHACVDVQGVLVLSGPNLTCGAGETPLDWSIQGPPGPTDPVLLGRISTLEAQVATLQAQMSGLISPVLPEVIISDVSMSEGASGFQDFTFTVALSTPSTDTVVVNFSTADGTADSADYTTRAGQLVFVPGETVKTVPVPVSGDVEVETNEEFYLQLDSVVNADPAGAFGTGTIINDDLPTISLSGQLSGFEGDLFTYDVVLSVPVQVQVSVNYSVIDGAATLADNDYIDSNGTLVFNAGQTSAQFTVQTNLDSIPESQEDFTVVLDTPVNASLATSQVNSLLLDPIALAISIEDASVIEGNKGIKPKMQMDIVLAQALTGQVSVRYGRAAGGTATNYSFFSRSGDVSVVAFSNCNADTSPASCPTIIFNPGETRRTIIIQINGDTVQEADENFFVKVFDPVGAMIVDDTAEGIIIDDD